MNKKHRDNISKSLLGNKNALGHIGWNKGKKGIYSKKTLKKMSKAKIGKPSNVAGLHWKHTENWKKENGLRMLGNTQGFQKDKAPWNKGIIRIDTGGNKHWNWQNGKSFEPYAPSWKSQLKEKVRVRDNFICQVCSIPELEFNKKLDIHHIDYNKKHCRENNLVSLCNSCHTKTNKNRLYWTNYFNQKLFNKKEGLLCCL